MKRKRSSKRRKRNCVKPEEVWDVIDAFRDATKENAINHYPGSDLSKCDLINVAVANFISEIVEISRPRPKLYRRWVNGERVTMNMILDSMGDFGIVVGAAAFRLAEQLEIELPDNGLENAVNFSVPVIDGEIMEEMASHLTKVSSCYLDYFFQDSKSMLCHQVYLAQRLKQKYEDENNQIGCEIIDELLAMAISCSSFSIGILCCMRLLVENEPIAEIIQTMLQDAQSRKKELKQLSKDEIPGNDLGRIWLDVLSCIHGCEKILGLLTSKAA
jgi:hypothetical protein